MSEDHIYQDDGQPGIVLARTDSVFQFSPSVMAAMVLLSFLFTAQMTMQSSAGFFICQYMLINTFMADGPGQMFFHLPTDLLWAPFLSNKYFCDHPRFSIDKGRGIYSGGGTELNYGLVCANNHD